MIGQSRVTDADQHNDAAESNSVFATQIPPSVSPVRPKPWGLWATLGLSMIILVAIWIGALVVGMVAGIVAGMNLNPDELRDFTANAQTSGLLISCMGLVTTPVAVGWVLLFVVMRNGPSISDYLALRRVGWKSMFGWSAAALALAMTSDVTNYLLGFPVIPDYMFQMYESAVVLPLFLFVMVFVAPFGDELLFRGFFFAGVAESRLGPAGAILLTSLAWAGMQAQREVQTVIVFFCLAISLGLARHRSKSIFPCIAMSMVWSCYSFLALILYTRMN